jgi:hypothetical protein
VLAAVVFVPVGSGIVSTCKITNRSTAQSYIDLQSGVNAASPGDTLFVQSTCTGTTIVATSLNLKGQRRTGSSTPTLDGGGSGSVLTIDDGVSVRSTRSRSPTAMAPPAGAAVESP